MKKEARAEQIATAADKINTLIEERNEQVARLERRYSKCIDAVCKLHKVDRSFIYRVIRGEK